MKTYSGIINTLESHQIFVFGSNTQGRHGKGAALTALKKFGAIPGQARGLQGQSYAICTKDLSKRVHPSVSTKEMYSEIAALYEFAIENKDKEFFVTYKTKSVPLNGHSPMDMILFFAEQDFIPPNIIFERSFGRHVRKLNREHNGTNR